MAPPLAPETRRSYEANLQNHILPYFGTWPLATITRADLRAFVAHLRSAEKPLTPKTLKNEAKTRPRARAVPRCGGPTSRQGSPHGDRGALAGGLRWGELIALRTEGIDYRRNVIHVTCQLQKRKLRMPKSRAGVRDVDMTPLVRKILQATDHEGLIFSPDGA
ncbi:MAG TPA: site-specific integrase [bacterium]|nr:site-specific integrase [bacterium]